MKVLLSPSSVSMGGGVRNRVRIDVQYDGSNYHGFQLQNNNHQGQDRIFPTVQSCLEKAIARVRSARRVVTLSRFANVCRANTGTYVLVQALELEERLIVTGASRTDSGARGMLCQHTTNRDQHCNPSCVLALEEVESNLLLGRYSRCVTTTL
jgi:tRNA U38,U39,U40 pseudouridine synthase TruA